MIALAAARQKRTEAVRPGIVVPETSRPAETRPAQGIIGFASERERLDRTWLYDLMRHKWRREQRPFADRYSVLLDTPWKLTDREWQRVQRTDPHMYDQLQLTNTMLENRHKRMEEGTSLQAPKETEVVQGETLPPDTPAPKQGRLQALLLELGRRMGTEQNPAFVYVVTEPPENIDPEVALWEEIGAFFADVGGAVVLGAAALYRMYKEHKARKAQRASSELMS